MQLKNEIMLITYADSLGNNLKDLGNILENDIKDAVAEYISFPFSRPPRTGGLHL